MQKIKYLLWLVVLVLLVIFIYQNSEYFMAEQSIGIDLHFWAESVSLPNLVYFLAVFLIGFLVSLLVSYSYGRKKRKTIKEQNETIASDKKRISELESKLEGIECAAYDKTTHIVSDADREKSVDAEFTRT